MQQQPPPPPPSRFDMEVERIQKSSSMGVFMPDLIQAKEGGLDIPTKIKLAISKQYFSLRQAIDAGILGSAFTTLIVSLILWSEGCIDFFAPSAGSAAAGANNNNNNASALYFGLFFLCFFLGNRGAHSSYLRELWCDPKVTSEQRYQGAPCIYTSNCWSRDDPGDTILCKPKPADINVIRLFHPFYWLLRYTFFFGPLVALIYFFIVFSQQDKKDYNPTQAFWAVLIGFATGWIAGWLLS